MTFVHSVRLEWLLDPHNLPNHSLQHKGSWEPCLDSAGLAYSKHRLEAAEGGFDNLGVADGTTNRSTYKRSIEADKEMTCVSLVEFTIRYK